MKPENKPTPGDVEQRSAPAETELTVSGNKLTGIVPYGIESRDLGGWTEVIEPGAFDNADTGDLVCTYNHDESRLLGRFDNTLKVENRDDGLAWSVELGSGPTAADVKDSVQRGDLNASSWRMVVGRDRWDGTVRHVEEVRSLRDLSVVTSAAYGADATAVELRNKPENTPPPVVEEPVNNESLEDEMKDENTGSPGLQVEDRSAEAAATAANVEERVLGAMRDVPKGESRSLTHSSVQAVEPPELSTHLFDKLRDSSVFLRTGVPVVATQREKVTYPTLTGDATVSFYGELEEIAASDLSFSELTVTPKAIKGLVRGSAESFEDSDPDLLSIVQQNLLTDMALKFDAQAIAGEASSKAFAGLLKISGTQTLKDTGKKRRSLPMTQSLRLSACCGRKTYPARSR